MRFEYCETSRKDVVYVRAIQGHSGGETIAPDLGEWTYSSRKRIRKTDSIFSPLNPLESDDEEEEYHDNMKIPRNVHDCSKWKNDQDSVFG